VRRLARDIETDDRDIETDDGKMNLMTCEEIQQHERMEQYLLGGLAPADRDELDQHLFECEACFERLQTMRALRRELAATAAVRAAEPPRADRGWIWKWALVPALAALVIIGLIVWPRVLVPPVPAPTISSGRPGGGSVTPPSGRDVPAPVSLIALGSFQPPAFTPGAFRGIQDEATRRFREGMTRYASGDYRGAIGGLRAASRLDPDAAHASFFLGICYVLTGQRDEGIRALQQTIRLGDSPYLDEAHFYLAKTYLQNNDPTSARQELDRTIALKGPLDREARQLLADLDRSQTRRP
jgi:Tetratricopeptide repeat/Putative zinc-finger